MQIFFVLCVVTMYIFAIQEIIRVFFRFASRNCALILDTIHLTDEQTNKAHRQIDGEPYFIISF